MKHPIVESTSLMLGGSLWNLRQTAKKILEKNAKKKRRSRLLPNSFARMRFAIIVTNPITRLSNNLKPKLQQKFILSGPDDVNRSISKFILSLPHYTRINFYH